MAPKFGAIVWEEPIRQGRTAARLQSIGITALEPEMGEVAIANGNAGAGHQQAVDGSHQAGEQAGRG